MKKKLYFILASFSLVFASCSMDKDNVSVCYLHSGKLQAEQQLTYKIAPEKQSTCGDVPLSQEFIQSDIINASNNSGNIMVQPPQIYSRSFGHKNIIIKAAKNLTQSITIPKATGTINRLMKKPSFTTSARSNPFEGMNYLLMWIIFLVAAVLFFFLVNVFGEVTLLGLVFNILAILALLAFILFLILWISQLYKANTGQTK